MATTRTCFYKSGKIKNLEHVKYSCSGFLQGVLFLCVVGVKCCILDGVFKHLSAILCWCVCVSVRLALPNHQHEARN